MRSIEGTLVADIALGRIGLASAQKSHLCEPFVCENMLACMNIYVHNNGLNSLINAFLKFNAFECAWLQLPDATAWHVLYSTLSELLPSTCMQQHT